MEEGQLDGLANVKLAPHKIPATHAEVQRLRD